MQRPDLERLNRDVRSIAERLPNNPMSSRTERVHVSEMLVKLTTEMQVMMQKNPEKT